ncbi:hypothetical protein CKC_01880 [Candidatus Liberibacter solanacearum CLso-ZC1]|uniref:Uncharacterized protein n=1 Tax=Liberibacter solanacearum (strain CLso-ZC1) TaxID=658172 RepID=E4UCN6_LIBSC|nr:hypothetical protein CKC_01880 [Candidatus Liberibacter solanacearum CLso-ZC1]
MKSKINDLIFRACFILNYSQEVFGVRLRCI